MEKQAAGIRKIFFRLLIFCLFINTYFSLYAKNPSWLELSKLKFHKGEEYFFTGTDCPFYIDIPDVKPENVQLNVNKLPDSVSFISSKKEVLMPRYNVDGTLLTPGGTHLVMYLKFEVAGRHRIPYVHMIMNGYYMTPAIGTVEVFENPRFMLPSIEIKFFDSESNEINVRKNQIRLKETEHLNFTIYIKYAVQLNVFTWDLPENSLFNEIKSFDEIHNVNKNKNTNFNPSPIPIATFDWQVLKKGTYELPKFYITATTYNGFDYDLEIPSYRIIVDSLNLKANPADEEKIKILFSYAFTEPLSAQNYTEEIKCTEQDLQALLSFYHYEINSFPLFNKSYKKRIELEKKLGLTQGKSKASKPFLYILITITVITLSVSIILFCVKRKIVAFIVLVFAAVSLVFTGIQMNKVLTETALYKGGAINSIPEKNITSGVRIKEGSCVVVLKKVGDWCYIRCNDTSGWIEKENLIMIK